MSLSEIKELNNRKEELVQNLDKARRELTVEKYQLTQKRLLEIDQKIERLLAEKENLLRKQRNRQEYLSTR